MSFPPFLIPILAGLVAQSLKPLLSRDWRAERALFPRLRYGGMPSAHAAFASSLAAVAAIKEGLDSAIFAIALAMLVLVIDDALRLRILLSRYGIALRRLLTRAPKEHSRGLPEIEHRMGHSLPEVLGGIAVGLLVTLLAFLLDTEVL